MRGDHGHGAEVDGVENLHLANLGIRRAVWRKRSMRKKQKVDEDEDKEKRKDKVVEQEDVEKEEE